MATVPDAIVLRLRVLILVCLQLSDEQAFCVLELLHLGASCEWHAPHHIPAWHLVHDLQLRSTQLHAEKSRAALGQLDEQGVDCFELCHRYARLTLLRSPDELDRHAACLRFHHKRLLGLSAFIVAAIALEEQLLALVAIAAAALFYRESALLPSLASLLAALIHCWILFITVAALGPNGLPLWSTRALWSEADHRGCDGGGERHCDSTHSAIALYDIALAPWRVRRRRWRWR
tara:strand:- start:943 stop:1641 length:699 start_codon:yes stop_codon:yes gene_type:complete